MSSNDGEIAALVSKDVQLDASLSEIIATVSSNDGDIATLQTATSNVDNTSDSTKVANMVAQSHTWSGANNTFNNVVNLGDSLNFNNGDTIITNTSSSAKIIVGNGAVANASQQISIGNSAYSNAGVGCSAPNSVLVGLSAGADASGGALFNNNIFLGLNAGRALQPVNVGSGQCYSNIAIGPDSLNNKTGNGNVCIGVHCYRYSSKYYGVSIGYQSAGGALATSNGQRSVSIGYRSAYNGIQDYCLCLGPNAGYSNVAYSIALNASNTILNTVQRGFYVQPVRNPGSAPTNYKNVYYDTDAKEVIILDDDKNLLLSSENTWGGASNTFTNDLTVQGDITTDTIEGSGAGAASFLYNTNTTKHIYIGGGLTTGQLRLGNSASSHATNIYGSVDFSAANSVSGLTQSTVGLPNVTNESKSTMFSSPNFTGTPTSVTPSTTNSSNQIATTSFVKSVLSTTNYPCEVHSGQQISSSGQTITPSYGPWYVFRGTGSGQDRTWKVDTPTLGLTMHLLKTETTNGFTINGESSGGDQVYFIHKGQLESNKVTSISFGNGDTYMRLFCPIYNNQWHVIEQY